MMMVMERQDRASTPKPRIFIDLSQDSEAEDPSYSPRAVKRPPVSPHKTASPRRARESDPPHHSPHRNNHHRPSASGSVPWKNQGQTTLSSYFKSPPPKPKFQSTMYSFFGANGTPPPPRREGKSPTPAKWARLNVPAASSTAPLPSPFRYVSPNVGVDSQLKEDMATAMLLSSQEASGNPHSASVINPLPGSTRGSLARPTHSIAGTPTPPGISPLASSSNYHKAFDTDADTSLFFPGGSQATTVSSRSGKLLYAGRNTENSPGYSIPQRRWCDSPAKRKYDEILDSQEPDSLGSQVISPISSPGLTQNLAAMSPPVAMPPQSGKRIKAMNPVLGRSQTNAISKVTTPSISSPTHLKQSPIPMSVGSPRRQVELTTSPSRTRRIATTPPKASIATNSPKAIFEGADDWEVIFENYDPFSDVEEADDEPWRRPARANQATKLGQSTQSRPNLQPADNSLALRLALASRIPIKSMRRPYLSRNARDFLRHTGRWDGFREFDGDLIHVDFTAKETWILVYAIATLTEMKIQHGETEYQYLARAVKKLLELGEVDLTKCMQTVREYLPGRTTNDCVLFAKDCLESRSHNASSGEFLRVKITKEPSTQSQEPRHKLRLRRELGWAIDRMSTSSETSRQIQHNMVHTIKPWKVFKEGSSDIMNIAWSPNGDKFALGTSTYSDTYNRPGNLSLGSVSESTIKMLHGHQTMRPEPLNGQDPILHSTVSGVGFSPSGLLFTGGYDCTVKVWQPEAPGAPLLTSRELDERVECLSMSPYHPNLVAVGCKSGTLELSSWDNDGNFLTASHCVLNKNTAEVLYPSCLAWGSTYHNRHLIAGYEAEAEKSIAGSLVVYDAESGRQFTKVTPGATRHFDVFSHPNGSFVAASAARGSKHLGIRSHVRMFNLTETGSSIEFDVDSEQLDINRVTISPCGTYVTSSATSGVTFVWDVRYPTNVLHRLQHEPTLMPTGLPDPDLEKDDTGVNVCLWSPNNSSDYLYTGSSDGIVKIWSVKRGEPFVRNLARVNAQIMSGAWSPGGDMLIVGDTSGTATLLSTLGEEGVKAGELEMKGDVLPQVVGADGAVESVRGEARGRARGASADIPIGELGTYYAEVLLETGKVVIGVGPNGPGAYAP